MRKTFEFLFVFTVLVFFSAPVMSAPLPYWADNGFVQFADDEGHTSGPGVGGQDFDAEYFYVKLDGSTLSVGLQSGFDLYDGVQTWTDDQTYYAGDLALSFDGNVVLGDSDTYEYAFDFGFDTHSYDNNTNYSGDDTGLYLVDEWGDDGDIHYTTSNPFAMATGDLVAGAGGATSGTESQLDWQSTYYRIASFDISGIENFQQLDVHWTMSCGNDVIDGSYTPDPVPEPATMVLLGSGLVGLALYRRRMKK